MHQAEGLITELKSAEIAGVSVATIRDYVRFGFLEPVEVNSEKFLKKQDVMDLFNNSTGSRPGADIPKDPPVSSLTGNFGEIEPSLDDQASQPLANQITSASVEPNKDATDLQSLRERIVKRGGGGGGVAHGSVKYDSAPAPVMYEIVGENKQLREEICSLKEERDWLRQRLEKLEARSEREQMLLLYESETLRSLIKQPKQSFWAFALPWIKGRG